MGGKRGHIPGGNTMLPRVFQVRNAVHEKRTVPNERHTHG